MSMYKEIVKACKTIATLDFFDACQDGGTSEVVDEQPGSAETRCSICFGGTFNTCYTDVCVHTFCYKCLELWLTINSFCPACNEHFRSDFRRSATKEGLLQADDVTQSSNGNSLTDCGALMVSSTPDNTDTIALNSGNERDNDTDTKQLSPVLISSSSTGNESSVLGHVRPLTSISIRKPMKAPSMNNLMCQRPVFKRGRILDFSSSDEESEGIQIKLKTSNDIVDNKEETETTGLDGSSSNKDSNVQTIDTTDCKQRKRKSKTSLNITDNQKQMKMTSLDFLLLGEESNAPIVQRMDCKKRKRKPETCDDNITYNKKKETMAVSDNKKRRRFLY